MSPSPRVKFAVVREDPNLEAELVERTAARAALTVASGGCTALTLCHRFPDLEVVAFDKSAAQLAHVREKARAVARFDLSALNAGTDDPQGLGQRGEFEALFRVLRAFFRELITAPGELDAFFGGRPEVDRGAMVDRWAASPFFAPAFEGCFADSVLGAMFGPAATQHAEKGSYPGYFRRAFERGLRRGDAPENPFLQHVLLGRYVGRGTPDFVSAGRLLSPTLVEASLPDVRGLDRFGVVSLSNVFDWSDDTLCEAWAAALLEHTRPGTAILIRQLNNERDVRRFFEPAFAFDDELGRSFLERDRSLFYNRFEVAFRR